MSVASSVGVSVGMGETGLDIDMKKLANGSGSEMDANSGLGSKQDATAIAAPPTAVGGSDIPAGVDTSKTPIIPPSAANHHQPIRRHVPSLPAAPTKKRRTGSHKESLQTRSKATTAASAAAAAAAFDSMSIAVKPALPPYVSESATSLSTASWSSILQSSFVFLAPDPSFPYELIEEKRLFQRYLNEHFRPLTQVDLLKLGMWTHIKAQIHHQQQQQQRDRQHPQQSSSQLGGHSMNGTNSDKDVSAVSISKLAEEAKHSSTTAMPSAAPAHASISPHPSSLPPLALATPRSGRRSSFSTAALSPLAFHASLPSSSSASSASSSTPASSVTSAIASSLFSVPSPLIFDRKTDPSFIVPPLGVRKEQECARSRPSSPIVENGVGDSGGVATTADADTATETDSAVTSDTSSVQLPSVGAEASLMLQLGLLPSRHDVDELQTLTNEYARQIGAPTTTTTPTPNNTSTVNSNGSDSHHTSTSASSHSTSVVVMLSNNYTGKRPSRSPSSHTHANANSTPSTPSATSVTQSGVPHAFAAPSPYANADTQSTLDPIAEAPQPPDHVLCEYMLTTMPKTTDAKTSTASDALTAMPSSSSTSSSASTSASSSSSPSPSLFSFSLSAHQPTHSFPPSHALQSVWPEVAALAMKRHDESVKERLAREAEEAARRQKEEAARKQAEADAASSKRSHHGSSSSVASSPSPVTTPLSSPLPPPDSHRMDIDGVDGLNCIDSIKTEHLQPIQESDTDMIDVSTSDLPRSSASIPTPTNQHAPSPTISRASTPSLTNAHTDPDELLKELLAAQMQLARQAILNRSACKQIVKRIRSNDLASFKLKQEQTEKYILTSYHRVARWQHIRLSMKVGTADVLLPRALLAYHRHKYQYDLDRETSPAALLAAAMLGDMLNEAAASSSDACSLLTAPKSDAELAHALETESYEHDDYSVCCVCFNTGPFLSNLPDDDQSADHTNPLIFCERCNACVHVHCYGLSNIPDGEWICQWCEEHPPTLPTVTRTNSRRNNQAVSNAQSHTPTPSIASPVYASFGSPTVPPSFPSPSPSSGSPAASPTSLYSFPASATGMPDSSPMCVKQETQAPPSASPPASDVSGESSDVSPLSPNAASIRSAARKAALAERSRRKAREREEAERSRAAGERQRQRDAIKRAERMKREDETPYPCCLCTVRGGALKPTDAFDTDIQDYMQYQAQFYPDDNKQQVSSGMAKEKEKEPKRLWAHIVCALWLPRTTVDDVSNMQCIKGVKEAWNYRTYKHGVSVSSLTSSNQHDESSSADDVSGKQENKSEGAGVSSGNVATTAAPSTNALTNHALVPNSLSNTQQLNSANTLSLGSTSNPATNGNAPTPTVGNESVEFQSAVATALGIPPSMVTPQLMAGFTSLGGFTSHNVNAFTHQLAIQQMLAGSGASFGMFGHAPSFGVPVAAPAVTLATAATPGPAVQAVVATSAGPNSNVSTNGLYGIPNDHGHQSGPNSSSDSGFSGFGRVGAPITPSTNFAASPFLLPLPPMPTTMPYHAMSAMYPAPTMSNTNISMLPNPSMGSTAALAALPMTASPAPSPTGATTDGMTQPSSVSPAPPPPPGTCALCKKAYGCCVFCSSDLCTQSFHPLCAWYAGLYMRVDGGGDTTDMHYYCYCYMHTPLKALAIQLEEVKNDDQPMSTPTGAVDGEMNDANIASDANSKQTAIKLEPDSPSANSSATTTKPDKEQRTAPVEGVNGSAASSSRSFSLPSLPGAPSPHAYDLGPDPNTYFPLVVVRLNPSDPASVAEFVSIFSYRNKLRLLQQREYRNRGRQEVTIRAKVQRKKRRIRLYGSGGHGGRRRSAHVRTTADGTPIFDRSTRDQVRLHPKEDQYELGRCAVCFCTDEEIRSKRVWEYAQDLREWKMQVAEATALGYAPPPQPHPQNHLMYPPEGGTVITNPTPSPSASGNGKRKTSQSSPSSMSIPPHVAAFFNANPLLRCSECEVEVHARCYGVQYEEVEAQIQAQERRKRKAQRAINMGLAATDNVNRGAMSRGNTSADGSSLRFNVASMQHELNEFYQQFEDERWEELEAANEADTQWKCRRCSEKDTKDIVCALCQRKGGAFKRTDCGSWVHMVCAQWIPEISFVDTHALEPVTGLDEITPARRRLKCYLCKRVGPCIECSEHTCAHAFHPLCGMLSGQLMLEVHDSANSSTFISSCRRHTQLHLARFITLPHAYTMMVAARQRVDNIKVMLEELKQRMGTHETDMERQQEEERKKWAEVRKSAPKASPPLSPIRSPSPASPSPSRSPPSAARRGRRQDSAAAAASPTPAQAIGVSGNMNAATTTATATTANLTTTPMNWSNSLLAMESMFGSGAGMNAFMQMLAASTAAGLSNDQAAAMAAMALPMQNLAIMQAQMQQQAQAQAQAASSPSPHASPVTAATAVSVCPSAFNTASSMSSSTSNATLAIHLSSTQTSPISSPPPTSTSTHTSTSNDAAVTPATTPTPASTPATSTSASASQPSAHTESNSSVPNNADNQASSTTKEMEKATIIPPTPIHHAPTTTPTSTASISLASSSPSPSSPPSRYYVPHDIDAEEEDDLPLAAIVEGHGQRVRAAAAAQARAQAQAQAIADSSTVPKSHATTTHSSTRKRKQTQEPSATSSKRAREQQSKRRGRTSSKHHAEEKGGR